jgi:hypothetical protein
MPLNLVIDEEVVIADESRYIKMSVRRDVEEIYSEIMNDKYLIKTFYGELEKNIKLMNELFEHITQMTPSQRIMRLGTLPPIPTFLCDNKSIFLKISKNQFNEIGKLARRLNTQMSNLARILFFMSIPRHLYAEFPYLMDHYQFAEQMINFYIEKTDGEKRLQLYDVLKNLI